MKLISRLINYILVMIFSSSTIECLIQIIKNFNGSFGLVLAFEVLGGLTLWMLVNVIIGLVEDYKGE